MSSVGGDAKISGAKIEPLDSDQKEGVERDPGGGGAAGKDSILEQARIDPGGQQGIGRNPEATTDDQGAVGRDSHIQGAKIEPLAGQAAHENTKPTTGLKEEEVSGARIEPLGEVREEMPQNQNQ